MPRKSTKKVEEAETKSIKKKKAVKKEEPAEFQINVGEMVKWTDEECEAKDKELRFRASDVRDILKAFVDANKTLKTTIEKFNLLKTTLIKGEMTGYRVKCPHCQREYAVGSVELHRDGEIACKVCGTLYKEPENIKGITVTGEGDEVTSI